MCLFVACMSYFVHVQKQVKITFGTKSDLEYSEVMKQLKLVHAALVEDFGVEAGSMLALCVTDKSKMCKHSSSVPPGAGSSQCELHDQSMADTFHLEPKIYTSEELEDYCSRAGVCPLYVAKRYVSHANVIVGTHDLLLN